jgi:hypothetical protein
VVKVVKADLEAKVGTAVLEALEVKAGKAVLEAKVVKVVLEAKVVKVMLEALVSVPVHTPAQPPVPVHTQLELHTRALLAQTQSLPFTLGWLFWRLSLSKG